MFDRIRAAWRAFWNSTAAPQVQPAKPDAKVALPFQISRAALFEADRHNSPVFLPEHTFKAPEPFPGVVPSGMAMDAVPSTNALVDFALNQAVHEGLGFLGYPYLSELSQRAEYRHVAGIWAEHCVRKWIRVTGDEGKVAKITKELERLDVVDLIREAVEKECFFGRMHLFMDFGDFDKPEELQTALILDKAKVASERPLKRLGLVEPMWCYPGAYSAQNPLAPDFYNPSSWYVSGRTVHASRMLTLVGRPMPNMLKPAYAFGGLALSQMIKPYVDNWLRTRQSVSDLIDAFSVMVLKTDMSEVLSGGIGTQLFARVDLFNKTRSNRGAFVVDKDAEEFENVSAPIAGLDKLQAQSLEQIASISGIPLVILLGVTPSGLNASSDGEIRAFYDKIAAYQEKVIGPNLTILLKVVQLSLFGEIDEDIGYEFESLWEMSDADKAAVRKSDAEADSAYITSGIVSPEEARERLNTEQGGLYQGRLAGPAPEPEADDEEDDLAFASDVRSGWSEEDHPRDEAGRFSDGGSMAIMQHVTKVLQSKGNIPPLDLGETTAGNVSVVQRHTGVDLTGYRRTLEASEIRHAMKSHGNATREAERAQIAIRKADYGLIPHIVEHAHHVALEGEPKSARPQRLTYTAKIGEHEYVYTESLRPNGKLVSLKTMRKR